MKVPEDQCPDPRVRYANFNYFPGLLDRGRFNAFPSGLSFYGFFSDPSALRREVMLDGIMKAIHIKCDGIFPDPGIRCKHIEAMERTIKYPEVGLDPCFFIILNQLGCFIAEGA